MIALDTSVVVPAVLSWHEAHSESAAAATGGSLPAHALVETYAVLTRLPTPHRLAPEVARALLDGWFGDNRVLAPSLRLSRSVHRRLEDAGVSGGASYDGLVALTAQEHGAELLTRDERAAGTYGRLRVAHRMLALSEP